MYIRRTNEQKGGGTTLSFVYILNLPYLTFSGQSCAGTKSFALKLDTSLPAGLETATHTARQRVHPQR